MDPYRQLAQALLDYLETCNKRNIAPLRWDLNYYADRLHALDDGRRA